MTTPAKNTICLWYNGDAEEAARLILFNVLRYKIKSRRMYAGFIVSLLPIYLLCKKFNKS